MLLSTAALALFGGAVAYAVSARFDPQAEAGPISEAQSVAAAGPGVEAESGAAAAVADEPLADFRGELLELAFESASAIPIRPHVKDRSRAQSAVVEACFELGQPRRALGYVERIENWRRGLGYAEYASYCARHGHASEAPAFLQRARDFAGSLDEETAQAWQRDRILAAVAGAHLWLGQDAEAAALEAGLVDSEIGAVEAARSMRTGAEDFDQRIEQLSAAVAAGTFEEVRSALEACAELFDRFYGDQGRRSRAEERIKASWTKLPVQVRIELGLRMVESALAHGDGGKALELVDETRILLEGSVWAAEERIPWMARLAGARHRAGDRDKARRDADTLVAMYEAERDRIVDIYRAGALRPLAEAFQEMGDAAAAREVYRRALEEGVGNPNSRPRAEDLSATCRSMALSDVEPDGEMWARMRAIRAALTAPW